MDQGIKSRPRYARLPWDESGARHLLVTDLAAVPPDTLAEGFDLAAVPVWSVIARSDLPPDPSAADRHPHSQQFRSAAQLLARLRVTLAQETMGLRLYVVGSETFLWDVAALGREAGLGTQEIRLAQAGNARRRVICTHCKTTIAEVTTNLVTCPGCGASLFVRDHFSRIHGAFMGVQVDAEIPGERPTAEELYR